MSYCTQNFIIDCGGILTCFLGSTNIFQPCWSTTWTSCFGQNPCSLFIHILVIQAKGIKVYQNLFSSDRLQFHPWSLSLWVLTLILTHAQRSRRLFPANLRMSKIDFNLRSKAPPSVPVCISATPGCGVFAVRAIHRGVSGMLMIRDSVWNAMVIKFLWSGPITFLSRPYKMWMINIAWGYDSFLVIFSVLVQCGLWHILLYCL